MLVEGRISVVYRDRRRRRDYHLDRARRKEELLLRQIAKTTEEKEK